MFTFITYLLTLKKHLKKSKNGHIWARIWSIGPKFSTVTHTHTSNSTGSSNYKVLKIQDGGRPPSWEIEQESQLPQRDRAKRYVSKFVLCFTSYWVILQTAKVTLKVIQGHWQWCNSKGHMGFTISKIGVCKNPTWRTTVIWKTVKSLLSRQRFNLSRQNQVWWNTFTIVAPEFCGRVCAWWATRWVLSRISSYVKRWRRPQNRKYITYCIFTRGLSHGHG